MSLAIVVFNTGIVCGYARASVLYGVFLMSRMSVALVYFGGWFGYTCSEIPISTPSTQPFFYSPSRIESAAQGSASSGPRTGSLPVLALAR